MATLGLGDEVPYAPLNTPVEALHHEMVSANAGDIHFADAISEALSAAKSDVAVGHPTLVPPNSPEHGFVRGSSLEQLDSPGPFLPLASIDEAISPLVDRYPDDDDVMMMDTTDREMGARFRLDEQSHAWDGMGSGVIGMGNDTASNGREHISQPASPTGETLPRAQGRPLSIRQQSPARQRENPVTSIQGLIDTIESIPAQVLQLTQQFLTDNAGDENAEQGRSGDNDSDDGCAEA